MSCYEDNKERIKEYYQLNKEKIKEYNKDNKEKIKEYNKEYYKKNIKKQYARDNVKICKAIIISISDNK